jgi:signal transduction histidine kinase
MSRPAKRATLRLTWLLGAAVLAQHAVLVAFLGGAPLRALLGMLASGAIALGGGLYITQRARALRTYGEKLGHLAESGEPSANAVLERKTWGPLAHPLGALAERLDASRALRRKAREASAYKASFLRSVRHELRTPLNSILGFADVLLGGLEGPLDEDQRESIGVIRGAAARLSQLFEEVIELTLLAADHGPHQQKELDPVALVDAVAEQLEGARGDRPVHIQRAQHEELRPLVGDAERLQKLMLCLASHALEHAAGPMLVLGSEAEGAYDVLYVRDPFRVLSAEEIAHLESNTPATRARRKGLGEDARLLVRLCKRIAAEHHGKARIESSEAEGTRFALCLPIAREPTGAFRLERA